MRKILFSVLFAGTSFISSAQLLSGDLVDAGRKMVSNYSFEIKDRYNGIQFFELAVNPEGKVTGVRHLDEKGILISTPARILASNQLSDLEFEKGTHFPKMHHVKVRVKFVKQAPKPEPKIN